MSKNKAKTQTYSTGGLYGTSTTGKRGTSYDPSDFETQLVNQTTSSIPAYLQQLTGRTDIPQAAAVIMQYTGYIQASQYDAPTYVCVGSNDGIASWRTMQNRLQRLSAIGIPTEFHVYDGLGHGFGIGTGTVADGWVNDALKFWQKNMKADESAGIPPVYAD